MNKKYVKKLNLYAGTEHTGLLMTEEYW